MAAVHLPPVFPDDAALLQMIQALQDRARTYQANRVLCKCPRGNWQGVNPDLMQGLRGLEDIVTTIEGNDQLCNCPLNGQQAGANTDQHPGLQDLENRVAVLEAANPAPCACPLNGQQVDGDGDTVLADAVVQTDDAVLADAVVQTDDTGQTDAAVQAGHIVDLVLPVQPVQSVQPAQPVQSLNSSQVAAVDGSVQSGDQDTVDVVAGPQPFVDYFPVMKLPPELRRIIWDAALKTDAEFYPTTMTREAPSALVRGSRNYTADRRRLGNLALLLVNRQFNYEATPAYYDRTFRIHGDWQRGGYRGIEAASDFIEDHGLLPNSMVRSLWIDATDSQSDSEYMIDVNPGRGQFTRMMQLVGQMPALQHFGLELSGEPPDLRRDPTANDWWTRESIVHWTDPFGGNSGRGLNRVALRVRFAMPTSDATPVTDWQQVYTPDMVARFVHFVGALRNTMLRGGDTLGHTLVHARLRHLVSMDPDAENDPARYLVVECDTQYDETKNSHIDHFDTEDRSLDFTSAYQPQPARDSSNDRSSSPSSDDSDDSMISIEYWKPVLDP